MAQKKTIALIGLLLLPLQFALGGETKTFGPMQFKLPDGWNCQTEGQNFICIDPSPASLHNSALVVSFKRRSGEDSLNVYKDQLSRPRTLTVDELTTPSQPKKVRELKINGVQWVEGIHLGSEIQEYFTHYFATVAGNFAVLVSISIHQSSYDQGLPAFQPTIDSFTLTVPQTAQDLSGAVSSNIPPAMSPASRKSVKRFEILGYKIPRTYVYLGGAFIAVLALLGYALISE